MKPWRCGQRRKAGMPGPRASAADSRRRNVRPASSPYELVRGLVLPRPVGSRVELENPWGPRRAPWWNLKWPPGRLASEREKAFVKKHTLLVILVPALLILSACGQPVSEDKAAYVGEWRAQTMGLLLTQDGSVAYKRLKGGVTTSLNGPLRRFEGDNFVVGVPLIATTFEVSKPPYQDAGQWKMVVDGVGPVAFGLRPFPRARA